MHRRYKTKANDIGWPTNARNIPKSQAFVEVSNSMGSATPCRCIFGHRCGEISAVAAFQSESAPAHRLPPLQCWRAWRIALHHHHS